MRVAGFDDVSCYSCGWLILIAIVFALLGDPESEALSMHSLHAASRRDLAEAEKIRSQNRVPSYMHMYPSRQPRNPYLPR